jgi:hypothetical protein
MIAYASRTGTRRNLDALRGAGWRLLVSATGVLRTEGFPYALDNGAWSAFSRQEAFCEASFVRALRKLGRDADWTVIPDIVAGGQASLEMSLRWMRQVLDECGRGLLAVQDGMEVADVRPFIGARVGIFVGGSTEWKERTMANWGELARETGAWLHVGRVNSQRRIRLCAMAGATSFDGTSATKFAETLRPLDAARRQMAFVLPAAPDKEKGKCS